MGSRSYATWYYIWIDDSSTNGDQQGPKIGKWIKADVCVAVEGETTKTCSFKPTDALAEGAGRWWVRTWIDTELGDWSDPMSFTVKE